MENIMDLTKQKRKIQHFVSLRDCVEMTIKTYLASMSDQHISNLYDMVLSEIEEPLLQVVMKHTHQNQSRAALYLGLSRGTLRTKLAQYGMLITNNKLM